MRIRLGEAGKDITENNVNNWSTGAYQLWPAQFNLLQETRVKQEVAIPNPHHLRLTATNFD